MKLPWGSPKKSTEEVFPINGNPSPKLQTTKNQSMEKSELKDSDNSAENPILTFDGKNYDINSLPEEIKDLIKGVKSTSTKMQLIFPSYRMLKT